MKSTVILSSLTLSKSCAPFAYNPYTFTVTYFFLTHHNLQHIYFFFFMSLSPQNRTCRLTGYIVYYSQTENSNAEISSPKPPVTIDNLISSTLYQFDVVAVAELNGDVVIGQRSPTSSIIGLIPTKYVAMTVYCFYSCIRFILCRC